MRRILLTAATLALMASALTNPAEAQVGNQDGVTALLTTANGIGNEIFNPDANGNILVRAILFQNTGVWSQVAANASLRVDVFQENTITAEHEESLDPLKVKAKVKVKVKVKRDNVVDVPFTSLANGAVLVTFPASSLHNSEGTGTTNAFDLYVVFDSPAGAESHHNLAKNQLINARQFDAADALDDAGHPAVTP